MSVLQEESTEVTTLAKLLTSGKLDAFEELLVALKFATKMLKIEQDVLSDCVSVLAEMTGSEYPEVLPAPTELLEDILTKYNV